MKVGMRVMDGMGDVGVVLRVDGAFAFVKFLSTSVWVAVASLATGPGDEPFPGWRDSAAAV